MNMIKNKDVMGIWVGVLIALAGAVCMAVPAISAMDMMNSGFGIMTIGFFIIIVGLITAAVFWQRARVMANILAGDSILASWVYSENESHHQVEEEYHQLKSSNRSTFTIVFAWFVVIGAVFLGVDFLATGEINGLFAGILFAVLALIGLTAFLAPLLWRRQASKSSRDVIIARCGLVLNGALHSWAGPLNRLEGVGWMEEQGKKTLVFEISSLSKTSLTMYAAYTVSIPVPSSKEAEAQKVLDYFSGEN